LLIDVFAGIVRVLVDGVVGVVAVVVSGSVVVFSRSVGFVSGVNGSTSTRTSTSTRWPSWWRCHHGST